MAKPIRSLNGGKVADEILKKLNSEDNQFPQLTVYHYFKHGRLAGCDLRVRRCYVQNASTSHLVEFTGGAVLTIELPAPEYGAKGTTFECRLKSGYTPDAFRNAVEKLMFKAGVMVSLQHKRNLLYRLLGAGNGFFSEDELEREIIQTGAADSYDEMDEDDVKVWAKAVVKKLNQNFDLEVTNG